MKLYNSRLNKPALTIATDYGLESRPILFIVDGVAHLGVAAKDDKAKMKIHGADYEIDESLYWYSDITGNDYRVNDMTNPEVLWVYLPENVKTPSI